MPTIGLLLDSFKGTLTQTEATAICARIFQDEGFQVMPAITSDGGDGFLSAVQALFPLFTRHTCVALDALGRPIRADYLIDESTKDAWIESASTIGLARLTTLDVRHASTEGLGLVILDALKAGAQRIIIGLGGSATSDGGIGMLASLGYLEGLTVAFPKDLYHAHLCCDLSFPVALIALSDVTNPLLGPNGAARVFAPQKGATPVDVRWLEEGLATFVQANSKQAFAMRPGSGAAGGLGFALSILGAEIKSGASFLLDCLEYEAKERSFAAVIVGEGSLDKQSLMGKIVGTVASRTHHAKLYALVGRSLLSKEEAKASGFMRIISLSELFGMEQAMTQAKECLAKAARMIAGEIKEEKRNQQC